MRLFIAIYPSAAMKKSLIGVLHELKKQGVGGNYIPLENLHLTLAFLGEVEDPDRVKAVLTSLPLEKARLSFSEFGFFSDTFWVGIKGSQKFKKYVADLRKTLSDQGISYDKSKFEPHITLIRKQKGKRPASLMVPKEEMLIEKVSLIRSEEKNGKRVYKEIFSVS